MKALRKLILKTPLRYITYSRHLYNGDRLRVNLLYNRERHFSLGFRFNGTRWNDYNDLRYWGNERWFVNHLHIYLLWFEIDCYWKRMLYYREETPK